MKTGHTHRFAFVAVALLAACSSGGDEEPSVVLERAAATAQQLRSASFDATFTYDTPDGISASGVIDGALTDGGRQSSFNVNADVTVPQEGADPTVHVAANVVVAGEGETYLRLQTVDGALPLLPGVGLVDESLLGTWIVVGKATSTGSSALSPDPAFIAMQASVLSVTDDRSYEEVDGERCYAYDVTLDQSKMLAFLERTAKERGQPFDRGAAETFLSSYEANGTIWIDAATSVIRRVSWRFEPAPGAQSATASFSLRLSKHNEPVEITPPADAKPLQDVLPEASLPAL